MRHRADLQIRPQKLFLSGHAEELSDFAIRHAALHQWQRAVTRLSLIRRTRRKTIATPDKEVHLVRIHLEEDVAKSFHFENSHGNRFQSRRHAIDGDCDATGDQFA